MGDAISKSEDYAEPSVLAVSLQQGTKLILNLLYFLHIVKLSLFTVNINIGVYCLLFYQN